MGSVGGPRPPLVNGPPIAGPIQPLSHMMQPPNSMMSSQAQPGMMMGSVTSATGINQGFPGIPPSPMMTMPSLASVGMPGMSSNPITSVYTIYGTLIVQPIVVHFTYLFSKVVKVSRPSNPLIMLIILLYSGH